MASMMGRPGIAPLLGIQKRKYATEHHSRVKHDYYQSISTYYIKMHTFTNHENLLINLLSYAVL